jgi:dTDP-4-dehydrorhamnose reductase
MTKKVLILGADGMLGSACYKTLKMNAELKITGTSRKDTSEFIRYESGLNSLDQILTKDYDYVINCIGVIKQKIDPNDQASISNAMEINANLPKQVAHLCELNSIKAIQIATDCAFSGSRGNYTELDPLDAEDFYGISKINGEVCSPSVLNLRCSIVGRELIGSYSLLEWFLAQKIRSKIQGYTNHFWNGISTSTFARILEGIISNDVFKCGTYHLLPADQTSKFELLNLFGELFHRSDIDIIPTSDARTVNRTLQTINPEFNSILWCNSSFGRVLSIKESVEDLARTNHQP